jgi:hypothetical protein
MAIGLKHLQAFKAIAAAAFVAMLFVLAPTAAQAHAGHQRLHAAPQTTQQTAQPVSKPEAAKRTNVIQEMKAAPLQRHVPQHVGCSDRGCCDDGSCAGSHLFVLVAVNDPIPPLHSQLLTIGNAPPHLDHHIYRLRRPPKSFA